MIGPSAARDWQAILLHKLWAILVLVYTFICEWRTRGVELSLWTQSTYKRYWSIVFRVNIDHSVGLGVSSHSSHKDVSRHTPLRPRRNTVGVLGDLNYNSTHTRSATKNFPILGTNVFTREAGRPFCSIHGIGVPCCFTSKTIAWNQRNDKQWLNQIRIRKIVDFLQCLPVHWAIRKCPLEQTRLFFVVERGRQLPFVGLICWWSGREHRTTLSLRMAMTVMVHPALRSRDCSRIARIQDVPGERLADIPSPYVNFSA